MILVMKFGGSSVANTERIINVANIIKSKIEEGYRPVVVVSAMGKTTDNLLNLAYEISENPPKREIDMLISVGERISMALLSTALNKMGIPSRSFTGSQVGIITENRFNNARIIEIKLNRVLDCIKNNEVPIIAGFQGVSVEKEITTLGRGGSDLTAIAIAIELKKRYKSVKCEIYTDVDGVYSIDPRIKHSAKFDKIPFDMLIEMASFGAKVMHSRAVSLSAKFNFPFYIYSSFKKGDGTMVGKMLESPKLKAITNMDVVEITMDYSDDILKKLSENDIQPVLFQKVLDKSILVIKLSDLKQFSYVFKSFEYTENRKLISIIGYGLSNSIEVQKEIIKYPVSNLSISDLRISFIVDSKYSNEIIKEIETKIKTDL
ncbi:MAG: aspartate kinase [candidate division WOR-3 bacterium]|nr:aspartate kinase [candidate division WOR-3 bacterium]MCX7948329.1 aspartate kinase [candidate division WOR-3 bacterium]MDW8150843.1 aspartate kinase [candidate division WOR-3 bacterium]